MARKQPCDFWHNWPSPRSTAVEIPHGSCKHHCKFILHLLVLACCSVLSIPRDEKQQNCGFLFSNKGQSSSCHMLSLLTDLVILRVVYSWSLVAYVIFPALQKWENRMLFSFAFVSAGWSVLGNLSKRVTDLLSGPLSLSWCTEFWNCKELLEMAKFPA